MADIEKEAVEMMEHKPAETDIARVPTHVNDGIAHTGSYWRDLVSFRDRAQEKRGLLAFPAQFSLPFRFLLVPAALYAAIAYGVILAG